jgi:hypothetical protein
MSSKTRADAFELKGGMWISGRLRRGLGTAEIDIE